MQQRWAPMIVEPKVNCNWLMLVAHNAGVYGIGWPVFSGALDQDDQG